MLILYRKLGTPLVVFLYFIQSGLNSTQNSLDLINKLRQIRWIVFSSTTVQQTLGSIKSKAREWVAHSNNTDVIAVLLNQLQFASNRDVCCTTSATTRFSVDQLLQVQVDCCVLFCLIKHIGCAGVLYERIVEVVARSVGRSNTNGNRNINWVKLLNFEIGIANVNRKIYNLTDHWVTFYYDRQQRRLFRELNWQKVWNAKQPLASDTAQHTAPQYQYKSVIIWFIYLG